MVGLKKNEYLLVFTEVRQKVANYTNFTIQNQKDIEMSIHNMSDSAVPHTFGTKHNLFILNLLNSLHRTLLNSLHQQVH